MSDTENTTLTPGSEDPKAIDTKRVYVGNISFKTKPADLKEAFAECGEVERANIAIQRSGRRLGFGFVTFATEEGANKAVETMNGTELEGRVVKVELAFVSTEEKKPRARKPRAPKNTDEDQNANEPKEETAPKAKKPRRVRVPSSEREVSSDVVYIAGLKTDVTKEELMELLDGFGVKSITLRLAYRGKENPRARFAFVYVDSAENQQKMVEKFNDQTFQDETLIVKSAFTQPHNEEEEGAENAPKKRTRKPRTRKPKLTPEEVTEGEPAEATTEA